MFDVISDGIYLGFYFVFYGEYSSFLAGSHHHSLFTLQRYVKFWQIPNTTLLSAKILFQQTSAIRDWVF